MTTQEPIYQALARLQHLDLSPIHAEMLRSAFAALHDGHVIALPDTIVDLIRTLDQVPAETNS